MRLLLVASLIFSSLSTYAMDLEYFVDNCTKQMVVVIQIDERVEALPDGGTDGQVIMAALRGFIADADRCSDVDTDFPKLLKVMKKLEI